MKNFRYNYLLVLNKKEREKLLKELKLVYFSSYIFINRVLDLVEFK